MSGHVRKNQRPAEKLSVLLDAGPGVLDRLREVKDATGLREMPWTNPRFKVIREKMEKQFPQYPNLQDVDCGDTTELRKQAKDICGDLEPLYLALHDSMELHTQVEKLLCEFADDHVLPAYADSPALVGAVLDLMVLWVRILLLVGDIPNKKPLVTFYAWAYQFATGIAEAHFTRLATLCHACGDRPAALAHARAACDALPAANAFRRVRLADALGALVLGPPAGAPDDRCVLRKRAKLAATLEEQDLLGAPLRADALQLPTGYKAAVQTHGAVQYSAEGEAVSSLPPY